MAKTFYSYLAYIQPTSNADIKLLKTNLDDFYSNQDNEYRPSISISNNEIKLTINRDYHFYINLSNEPHVIEEAIEFSENSKNDWAENPFDIKKLKSCNKRFEIWGEEDYDMDYFNDSLFIIEQIEKFSDIIIFHLD